MQRLLIAGPRSGVGKTSITLGLIAALTEQGRKVQPFKVGPDFIDAGFHAALSGRPCYNLDGWMMPGERLLGTFERAMRHGADVGVVEGMMGLYDGAGTGESGTTSADIAKRLSVPVILVLDVFAMAGSAGAAALGYREFDPEVEIAGVILNRVVGERHAAACGEALESAGFRLFGVVPADDRFELPERHLGLIPAWEETGAARVLREVAAGIGDHLDLDGLLEAAAEAPPLAEGPRPPDAPATTGSGRGGNGNGNGRGDGESAGARRAARIRIGIARDDAFGFYYQDTLDTLVAAGAELVTFAPTRDEALPRDLGGLYLGGGFPERYLDVLEANMPLRTEIAAAAGAGMPIYAECGGLMYLCRSIAAADGPRRAMVGVLDGHVRMGGRQAIAYVEVEVRADTPLAPAGSRIRGHVFHNSLVERIGEGSQFAYQLTPGPGITGESDGWLSGLSGNVLAGYTHLPLAAYPEFIERWLSCCRAYRGTRATAHEDDL
jgi:cobyrinic acid a,c-diamide synthase